MIQIQSFLFDWHCNFLVGLHSECIGLYDTDQVGQNPCLTYKPSETDHPHKPKQILPLPLNLFCAPYPHQHPQEPSCEHMHQGPPSFHYDVCQGVDN